MDNRNWSSWNSFNWLFIWAESFVRKVPLFFFVCTMLDYNYFIHFSNFAAISLAYSKFLRIFADDFGARLLASRGDEWKGNQVKILSRHRCCKLRMCPRYSKSHCSVAEWEGIEDGASQKTCQYLLFKSFRVIKASDTLQFHGVFWFAPLLEIIGKSCFLHAFCWIYLK